MPFKVKQNVNSPQLQLVFNLQATCLIMLQYEHYFIRNTQIL